MDKTQIVSLLNELYLENCAAHPLEDACKAKFETIINKIPVSYTDISQTLVLHLKYYNYELETSELKYLCLNFYLIDLLKETLEAPDVILTVAQTKQIKDCLKNLIAIGIGKNLQKNLPFHAKIPHQSSTDILYNYNVLKLSTAFFSKLQTHLKMLIVQHQNCLQTILMALYQIAFCPLKRPSDTGVVNNQNYEQLIKDQAEFASLLIDLQNDLHPAILTRATMTLFHRNIPPWLSRKLSSTLTGLIRSPKGIQRISAVMMDGVEDDVNQTWRIMDVLVKVVLSCHNADDFRGNICGQLVDILDFSCRFEQAKVLERFVAKIANELAVTHSEIFLQLFLPRILRFWYRFAADNKSELSQEDVANELRQSVRLLEELFSQSWPDEIKPVIKIIFHFFHLLKGSKHFEIEFDTLKEFQFGYLKQFDFEALCQFFDALLFGYCHNGIRAVRKDATIELTPDGKLIARKSDVKVVNSLSVRLDSLFLLFDAHLKVQLFGFLLKCLMQPEKYFLADEDAIENVLAAHSALTRLSQDADVMKILKQKPEFILSYIRTVFEQTVKKGADGDEMFFTLLMIVDVLIGESDDEICKSYECLRHPLEIIERQTKNVEVMRMCRRIGLRLKQQVETKKEEGCSNELDKALEDCCDPLLPVRAHGLLAISKLLEKKDKAAMERSQYLLNMFQLYLEDTDSYIYLNAVRALSTLAELYPQTVLQVLCEQFTRYIPKEGVDELEVRLKLGQVLVQVVQKLGDRCSEHKALLLNTFLAATKDDDHLIRASSLSNLGEVCRVLGFRLGTIVQEVLACVHGVVATDKAPEPRRAAVAVLRQLLIGLSTEMLRYLRGDMLPVYRTLKEIYRNDQDEVVRLQAQLALEELNENMKEMLRLN